MKRQADSHPRATESQRLTTSFPFRNAIFFLTQVSADPERVAGNSLSDLWMDFLITETDDGAAPR